MNFFIQNLLLIVAVLVSGGLLLRPIIQKRLSGARTVGTLEATRMINDRDAVVLDVRTQAEFDRGHLPAARHIPLEDVDKRKGELPAGRPVIVVCGTGARSLQAARVLMTAGHETVTSLEGGTAAWEQAGLPLVR